jgi:hypothetical protein
MKIQLTYVRVVSYALIFMKLPEDDNIFKKLFFFFITY